MANLTSSGYRAAAGPLPIAPVTGYRAQWRDYALRRGLAKLLVYLAPAVVVGGFLLSRLFFHVPEVVLPAMVLWLALAYVAVRWAGEFRCPRCRRRYGALNTRKGLSVIFRGLFDDICYNCKLRKFTDG